MRRFTPSDRALLERLSVVAREGPLPMGRFLQTVHFSEAAGRALILQPHGRFGYLYVRPARLAEPGTAARERQQLMELWMLLAWLRQQGLLALTVDDGPVPDALSFVGESLDAVRLEKSRIVVNTRGDYSDEPNRIVSAHGDPVFEGIRLEGDAFDMAWRHTRGTLLVSAGIDDLLPRSEPAALPPSTPAVVQAPASLPRSRWTRRAAWAGTAASMLGSAWWGWSDPSVDAPSDSTRPVASSATSAAASGAAAQARPVTLPPSHGIDLSKWNGDWLEHLQGPLLGIAFAYARASDGLTVDPSFAAHWKALAEKGLVRGAYHFYRADLDPKAQMHGFVQRVGPPGPKDLPVAVDLEAASFAAVPAHVDPRVVVEGLLDALAALERLGGRTPVVYTNLETGERWLTDARFSRYPLWIADWSSREAPRLPSAWRERGHLIWQRTDRYALPAAGGLALDLDIYPGSAEQLLATTRSTPGLGRPLSSPTPTPAAGSGPG